MSKSYQRTVCFVSLVFTLTGCESDADKLQRLNGDRAVNCLLVQKYREDLDVASKAKQPYSSYRDTLLQEWNEANTRCELATRDLNRFMR